MIGTTVVLIPVANLDMSKPAAFDKPQVKQLSVSMKSDGLIVRPLVRPNPEKPGYYNVIHGRKRIYAAGKFLGWTEIECDVTEMDDESAGSVEDAENLFRASLSEEEQKKALIRWHAVYSKRNPTADGKGAAKKQQAAAKAEADKPAKKTKKTTETTMTTETEEPAVTEAASPSAPAKPFSKVLEETLGISRASAGRLARVARNLTEDQITVLASKKVTSVQTDEIAALGKGEAIDQAIKLIASGMNADEAIRQAGKLKAEKPAKAASSKAEGKPAAAPKAKELTDDEWLATYCSSILTHLKHKVAFKQDAILYRRVGEHLTRFRTGVKKAVAEQKSAAGHNGAFFTNMYRLIKASHPQHWLVCAGCEGTGKEKSDKGDAAMCQKCFGAAYKMKLED